MDPDEIIEELREMEHMMELEYDQLPELPDGEPWAANWVRFHDALTGTMVCVNESDTENDEELGTVIIVSDADITIPPSDVKKFIAIEKNKSNGLAQLSASGLDTTTNRVEAFRGMNHMIEIEQPDTPKGWVAFHDSNTKKTVCINRANTQYDTEPVGTMVVISDVIVTIPEHKADKYLQAHQKQSNALNSAMENVNDSKNKSESKIEYKF